MAPAFLLVLFPFYLSVITFCYLSIYFRKKHSNGKSKRLIFENAKKRLANTVAWILLILVLTYFPGLLFGAVLVANGVNNLPFRTFYVIFMQLNTLRAEALFTRSHTAKM